MDATTRTRTSAVWSARAPDPRLPWAPRLPAFIADPAPVLELLELLRDDPSEYVRRSVANNLNDISKDHPDVVVDVAGRWWADGDEQRRRLVAARPADARQARRPRRPRGAGTCGRRPPGRPGGVGRPDRPGDRGQRADHGNRGRHPVTRRRRGLSASAAVGDRARRPRPSPPADPRPAGESVAAPASTAQLVAVVPESAQHVAVDFVVHFVKANGSTSPRVFKGAVRELGPGGSTVVTRLVSLAQQSTRTHHPGVHRVEVQVNGQRSDAGVVPPVPSRRVSPARAVAPSRTSGQAELADAPDEAADDVVGALGEGVEGEPREVQ